MDKEKTIKGLEKCADLGHGFCNGCPYDRDDDGEYAQDCTDELCKDTLELVRSYEPHVMTVEELEDALDTVVWMEYRSKPEQNTAMQYRLITAYSCKLKYIDLVGFDGMPEMIKYEHIGVYFRFWNLRPYDNQRKAAKWDDK